MTLAIAVAVVMSALALAISLRLLWLDVKSDEGSREPESDAALRSRVVEYMQHKYRTDMNEIYTATGETLDAWAWYCRLRRNGT